MSNPTVGDIVARAAASAPRLGDTRLVLIDGPAGSGKTTLAQRVADRLDAQVIHGDDIYEGWHGLATMEPILLGEILEPLARGDNARFNRWDWHEDRRGEKIAIPVADALVIEGVGVAQRSARPYASLVVWVEAPWNERLRRGIERDGAHMESEWVRWEADESRFFDAERPRDAADVIVDGTQPVPD